MTSKKHAKPFKKAHSPPKKHSPPSKKAVISPKTVLKPVAAPPARPAKRPPSMEKFDRFFAPKTVAIIGASREEHKIGNVVVANFIRSFRGKVIPVNPNATEVYGMPCAKSIKDVKEIVDLAVIAIPAEKALGALREVGQKKIPNVVMISSGFKEIGNEKLQKELEKILQTYPQTKLMGPNCLGVLDTKTGVDTIFLPADRLGRPQEGTISFISQSGALGSAILDWDALKGYGINKFMSIGNATNVNETDLLQYLSWDASTKIITMYIEGVQNGKRFADVLRETTQQKPVIILKGGQSNAGDAAVKSHTGALSGSAAVFETAVKQAGGIMAHSMEELFDLARTMANEPKAKGSRVQIITNGGGYGILAADAIESVHLPLAKMSEKSIKEIQAVCPPYASLKNPMDLTGDADNQRYRVAINSALLDENVDAIVLILLFQVPKLTDSIASELAAQLKGRTKPVLVLSVGGAYSEEKRKELENAGITTFQEPTAVARVLGSLLKH